MRADAKAAWTSALRGGLYPQGRTSLRSKSGRYCAFGVLCDVIRPQSWADRGFAFAFQEAGEPYYSVPPPGLLEELDISDVEADAVIDLNDAGDPFEAIASYIEENL